jgi:hypothetical protein
MPPKAAGKEKIVDSEEVLQAVVIAETFNERFKPLTTNKPRVSLLYRHHQHRGSLTRCTMYPF